MSCPGRDDPGATVTRATGSGPGTAGGAVPGPVSEALNSQISAVDGSSTGPDPTPRAEDPAGGDGSRPRLSPSGQQHHIVVRTRPWRSHRV